MADYSGLASGADIDKIAGLDSRLVDAGISGDTFTDKMVDLSGKTKDIAHILTKRKSFLPNNLLSKGTLICDYQNLDNLTTPDNTKVSIVSNEKTFFNTTFIKYVDTVAGANFSFRKPINLTINKEDFISLYFWSDNYANFGNVSILLSNSADNVYNYATVSVKTKTIIKSNEWNNILIPVKNFTFVGNATLKDNFKQGIIQIYGIAGKTNNIKLGGLYLNQKPRTAITFSFDDCNVTDYTVAYTKLKSKGFNGISYIISEEIGTSPGSPALPRLSLVQLKEMHANGWFIGIHGKDWYNWVTEKTIAEAEISIKACRDYIITNDIVNDGIKSVAYPHGLYNDDVIALLKKYGITNARTTNVNIQSSPVEDMHKLKLGIPLKLTLQENIDALESILAQGGGLINIYCHEMYDDRGATTPLVFGQFVDYIYDNYKELVTTIPDWVRENETGGFY